MGWVIRIGDFRFRRSVFFRGMGLRCIRICSFLRARSGSGWSLSGSFGIFVGCVTGIRGRWF